MQVHWGQRCMFCVCSGLSRGSRPELRQGGQLLLRLRRTGDHLSWPVSGDEASCARTTRPPPLSLYCRCRAQWLAREREVLVAPFRRPRLLHVHRPVRGRHRQAVGRMRGEGCGPNSGRQGAQEARPGRRASLRETEAHAPHAAVGLRGLALQVAHRVLQASPEHSRSTSRTVPRVPGTLIYVLIFSLWDQFLSNFYCSSPMFAYCALAKLWRAVCHLFFQSSRDLMKLGEELLQRVMREIRKSSVSLNALSEKSGHPRLLAALASLHRGLISKQLQLSIYQSKKDAPRSPESSALMVLLFTRSLSLILTFAA